MSGPNQNDITLKQLNEMLSNAGFPIISKDMITRLQELAPRERIIRAIQGAYNDPGAKKYLINLFRNAGIMQTNQEPQGGQQAPQQANQNQQQRPQGGQHNSQYGGQSHGQAPQQGYQSSAPQGGAPQDDSAGRMNPEDRHSVHVYGGKAALCFDADLTKGGVATVALDAAPSVGQRQYNWQKKVRLQMTRNELPVVLAVLLGFKQSCEFKNHGQDNSKGFSMERQQGGKIFIKVFAKEEGVKAVPVEATDVFYVTALFMRQLQKSMPWMDNTSLVTLVRSTQGDQGGAQASQQQRRAPQQGGQGYGPHGYQDQGAPQGGYRNYPQH